ncbi:hypothetical protein LP420_07020 [Massilia sp. B-10]|nr:hypothetical protein LP420_07020 [Massilia sp. B-10]
MTCVITPRLPSDTRAAASRSGLRPLMSSSSPLGVISCSDVTSACMG